MQLATVYHFPHRDATSPIPLPGYGRRGIEIRVVERIYRRQLKNHTPGSRNMCPVWLPAADAVDRWTPSCWRIHFFDRPPSLPPQQTFGSRSEARRARAARRGGAEAGALHPARGRHRLAPQLTDLRPLRRRATGVAQKATPGVGCSLDPSPAAPSPGRLTAHGALGCSPPPPRVPRRQSFRTLQSFADSLAGK